MIVRRIALLFALIFAFIATQLPEFVEQYRQRLGGVIDELAQTVARFDADAAQQGLTESGGIDRLKANGDQLARERGADLQDDVARLEALRETQTQFHDEGQIARLGTFVTHYDNKLARSTLGDYEPAVPATIEGLVLGLFGFVFGGGIVHVAGRPLARRRRSRELRDATRVA